MRAIFKTILIWLLFLTVAACDTNENNTSNKGTTSPNKGTTNQNIGTTSSNNGTTNQNNGTTSSNNGTTNQNNGTTSPNNGTTNQNNETIAICEEASSITGDCDPFCKTGCTDGETCIAGIPFGETQLTEACNFIGTNTEGMACVADNGCLDGLGCLDGKCFKYCRFPEGEPSCAEGRFCNRLRNGANIGICVEPCNLFPDSCNSSTKCVRTILGNLCVLFGQKMIGDSCSPVLVEKV